MYLRISYTDFGGAVVKLFNMQYNIFVIATFCKKFTFIVNVNRNVLLTIFQLSHDRNIIEWFS